MFQICVIIFMFLKVDRMQFQHHIKSKHSNVRLLAIQMPVLRHFSHDLELHVLSNSNFPLCKIMKMMLPYLQLLSEINVIICIKFISTSPTKCIHLKYRSVSIFIICCASVCTILLSKQSLCPQGTEFVRHTDSNKQVAYIFLCFMIGTSIGTIKDMQPSFNS